MGGVMEASRCSGGMARTGEWASTAPSGWGAQESDGAGDVDLGFRAVPAIRLRAETRQQTSA
ncbi:hypothetical protein GCM10010289_74670 [Streptomyces violascens]|nr:hypothetical protein GCM10010289_74670 [Streptomyces violascens]